MRKAISIFLFVAILGPAVNLSPPTHAQENPPAAKAVDQVLTNKDVMDLLKSGLSAEIIVAKIKSSKTNFDTSTSALQELKTVGAPDSVVLAMIQAGASSSVPISAATTTKEVVVDDGTPVEIELLTVASSEVMKAGDVVDFKVVRAVEFKGVTVIEKDAIAKGRITEAKKAGFWGRAGKLEWAMQYVVAVDNSRIPLRFTQRTVGDSKGATVAIGAVATTFLLGPAALFWGLKRGKPVVVSSGNRYYVFVHGTPIVKGQNLAAK